MATLLEFDARSALQAFSDLRGIDFVPALNDVNGYLISETARRFDQSIDWQGRALESSKRAEAEGGKTLVKRGHYRDSYTGNVLPDGMSTEFGTNDIRAGTLHFGARKGAYGSMRNGLPIPWGDIPARMVAGINDDDELEIFDIFESFMRTEISRLGGAQ